MHVKYKCYSHCDIKDVKAVRFSSQFGTNEETEWPYNDLSDSFLLTCGWGFNMVRYITDCNLDSVMYVGLGMVSYFGPVLFGPNY